MITDRPTLRVSNRAASFHRDKLTARSVFHERSNFRRTARENSRRNTEGSRQLLTNYWGTRERCETSCFTRERNSCYELISGQLTSSEERHFFVTVVTSYSGRAGDTGALPLISPGRTGRITLGQIPGQSGARSSSSFGHLGHQRAAD